MKINKNWHCSCQNRIFTPSNSVRIGLDKVHTVRPVDNNNDMPFPSHNFNSLNARVAAKTKNGFLKYKRPVEVGTNIEVEALLVSSRRRLLA